MRFSTGYAPSWPSRNWRATKISLCRGWPAVPAFQRVRYRARVNRLAGKNVSQFINDFRIAEACRLLSETDMPVTAAMFESGFQTKSNFNREFRRVTALSPAAWRERSRSEALAIVARVGAEDA